VSLRSLVDDECAPGDDGELQGLLGPNGEQVSVDGPRGERLRALVARYNRGLDAAAQGENAVVPVTGGANSPEDSGLSSPVRLTGLREDLRGETALYGRPQPPIDSDAMRGGRMSLTGTAGDQPACRWQAG